MKHVYLDYAAATPVDDGVAAVMKTYLQEQFFNPSAIYLAAKEVAKDIQIARETVARCLGARPSEVIFTAGGTEADNLAIHGVMNEFPEGNVIVSAIEHEAVLAAAELHAHKICPVDARGMVILSKLEKLIDEQTVLVSVMYANNEIGSVQHISAVSKLIQKIQELRAKDGNKLPLYLHTDASQAANHLDVHVSRLGVDLMTLNGGKMYGPKQTGALFVKAGVKISSLIQGGGQERGMRSGTENVAGIMGFAAALTMAQDLRKAENERLSTLQTAFQTSLEQVIPNVIINSRGHSLPNITHITIPGADNEMVVMQLDESGVMCAVGSACSASSDEPSHVLKAIGLSNADARGSIRFSMGRGTTEADIDYTVEALKKILN